MADARKKLVRAVNVDGEWYQPGDDVPAEVAERITNPKAWTSEEELAVEQEKRLGLDAGTTSGARLAKSVHVDGVAYGPDDHVPDDVADKIRNPKAWESGVLPGQSKPKAANPAAGEDDGGDQDPQAPAGGEGEATAPKAARKAPPARRA